ncbi:MAG: hypothetical protein GY751_24290 [Bacteroidetes bacterium]|nr:hypothetical protein [Bacteroidota bacterium]
MSYFKKILFTLFAIFLLWQSFELVSGLIQSEVLDVGKSLVNAFMINLYITGIFAFPGFVFPTHKLIGSAYYKLRNPKVLMKMYRMLGVSYFRWLLLVVFWGRKEAKQIKILQWNQRRATAFHLSVQTIRVWAYGSHAHDNGYPTHAVDQRPYSHCFACDGY